MRAGSLDRVITIDTYSATQDPGSGEDVPVWSPLATMRAEVIQSGADEFLKAGGVNGEVAVIFRTRFIENVTVQCRVHFDDRVFNLVEVKELGRREGLELRGKAASE